MAKRGSEKYLRLRPAAARRRREIHVRTHNQAAGTFLVILLLMGFLLLFGAVVVYFE